MQYRFAQFSEFINVDNLDVFTQEYITKGWAPYAQGSLGAGWSLSNQ